LNLVLGSYYAPTSSVYVSPHTIVAKVEARAMLIQVEFLYYYFFLLSNGTPTPYFIG
jgi:hypothetical protein